MQSTHSLVYLLTDTDVCLGFKKRGFGAGYYNGFGGKIHTNETSRASAVREVFEETGVTVTESDLTCVASLTFTFVDGTQVIVDVYATTAWNGIPSESDEMQPQWFSLDDLPYTRMWETDAAWLPRVLAGERLTGAAKFAADGATVTTQQYEPMQF